MLATAGIEEEKKEDIVCVYVREIMMRVGRQAGRPGKGSE